jgi:hypothetical protein
MIESITMVRANKEEIIKETRSQRNSGARLTLFITTYSQRN